MIQLRSSQFAIFNLQFSICNCSRLFAAAAVVSLTFAASAQDSPGPAIPPKVFLDKSPAVVRYQLKRLTNAQLAAQERDPTDPKYKLVYEALLTRTGLAREVRTEAAEALAKLNASSPVVELLRGIESAEADDHTTRRELASLALVRPTGEVAAARESLMSIASGSADSTTRSVAYAALALADGGAQSVWEFAGQSSDGRVLLLQSVPGIPDARVRATFRPYAAPLVFEGRYDEPLHRAALMSICYIPGDERQTFQSLAHVVMHQAGDPWNIAVRSIRHISTAHWPLDTLEPLARAVVGAVERMTPETRTSPAGLEAVALGHDLAAALPPSAGAPIRKALRELGVRVVLMKAVREQMLYDLRYFVVEAGKPVQLVLVNDDAMPHNIVIIAPGSLTEVGLAAASLPLPADPAVKPYVPDSPKVLHASHLINGGQSLTLSFDAPAEPGEYIYVCTYPGHFVRMYGVMLVVKDIEAWEASPIPPKDPLTGQPYTSVRTDASADAGSHHEH